MLRHRPRIISRSFRTNLREAKAYEYQCECQRWQKASRVFNATKQTAVQKTTMYETDRKLLILMNKGDKMGYVELHNDYCLTK